MISLTNKVFTAVNLKIKLGLRLCEIEVWFLKRMRVFFPRRERCIRFI